MIVAANRFIPGRPEKVCMDLFDMRGTRVTVRLKLKEVWYNNRWASIPTVARSTTVDTGDINNRGL